MVHPALNAELQLMKPISEQSEAALHGADEGLQGLSVCLKWYIKAMCTGLTNPVRHKLSLPMPHSQDVVYPLLKQDSKSLIQSHQFVWLPKGSAYCLVSWNQGAYPEHSRTNCTQSRERWCYKLNKSWLQDQHRSQAHFLAPWSYIYLIIPVLQGIPLPQVSHSVVAQMDIKAFCYIGMTPKKADWGGNFKHMATCQACFQVICNFSRSIQK